MPRSRRPATGGTPTGYGYEVDELTATLAVLNAAARAADPERYDWVAAHRPVQSVDGLSPEATAWAVKVCKQWAREVGVDDGLSLTEMQRRHAHWKQRVRSVTTP